MNDYKKKYLKYKNKYLEAKKIYGGADLAPVDDSSSVPAASNQSLNDRIDALQQQIKDLPPVGEDLDIVLDKCRTSTDLEEKEAKITNLETQLELVKAELEAATSPPALSRTASATPKKIDQTAVLLSPFEDMRRDQIEKIDNLEQAEETLDFLIGEMVKQKEEAEQAAELAALESKKTDALKDITPEEKLQVLKEKLIEEFYTQYYQALPPPAPPPATLQDKPPPPPLQQGTVKPNTVSRSKSLG